MGAALRLVRHFGIRRALASHQVVEVEECVIPQLFRGGRLSRV
jgi:hypothetical protein